MIPTEWIQQFHPYGNAQLRFVVGNGALSTSPESGNYVEGEAVLEYLASIVLEGPGYTAAPGSDTTEYRARGKVLRPLVLDHRITNGSTADAVINGVRGRFEVVFDAAQNPAYLPDLHQNILGTFRVVGGGR